MRMTSARFWLGALLVSAAVGTAALAAQQQTVRDKAKQFAASANPHIRLFAYVLRDAVWLQADHVVYVCWENVDPAVADAQAVRTAVAGTWEHESGLTFKGWQRCAAASRGVRIRVDDSGPHTKGLGRALDGLAAGMVLNFTFNNWSPACQTAHDYCVKGIAVHEFGHAIGFAHEQNRPDAPGECRQLAQGGNGDLLLTPYDPQSVMNYCNQKYNNDGNLSSLDASAVRELYGAPADVAH